MPLALLSAHSAGGRPSSRRRSAKSPPSAAFSARYDPSTLAPLGLVVGGDELLGRRIWVLPSGEDRDCRISNVPGMEGADCADAEGAAEEQAVLLVGGDDGDAVTVVQPNEDGSYWRKIVRNKIVRMKEKRRVQAASAFAKELALGDEARVVSSWGPYTQISGTAKNTGVKGITKAVA